MHFIEVTSTGFELTPVAIAAGRRLADRLFLGEGRREARVEGPEMEHT